MSSLRTILAAISIVGLTIGYGLSQWSFFNGSSSEYARSVDQPSIAYLALAVVAILVLGAFAPQSEDDAQ